MFCCLRCKILMSKHCSSGRMCEGSSKDIVITGYSCWCCGNWVDCNTTLENNCIVDSPSKKQIYKGGRRSHVPVPPDPVPSHPAEVAVIKYFEVIVKKRRAKVSWRLITNYIFGIGGGGDFTADMLAKFYEQEVLRRLEKRTYTRNAARQKNMQMMEAA